MTRTFSTSVDTLAASLAPEDIRCGDDVAVLNEMSEYPSFLWEDPAAAPMDALVRVWWRPTEPGMPLRVKAVCLPFLFVKAASGETRSLDVRQVQLVRLSRRYARIVRKALKSQRRRRRTKSGKP